MRWIYISPHLDDAIFSAGGLIYEQVQYGAPVEIWTVMSGFPDHVELSPFAKSIHQQWGTSSARETIQKRRKENEVAAAVLGAKNRYLDFIDSLYRHGSGGQALYTSSFSPLNKEEKDLPRRIAEELVKYLLPNDALICPLTLGGHIDHIIVREAINFLDLSPFYMADIPYLLDNPRSLWRKTLGMKQSIHEISKEGLQYWLRAIRSYETQIKVEFESNELMEKSIIAYWKTNKGIRIWNKR
jgi:LmbE family N-acetylglucosaminyl deacetylase